MVALHKKYVSILLTAVVLFLVSSIPVLAHTVVDASFPDDDDDAEQACMQDAVSDRDIVMITAWEEYSMSIMSALETRRSDVMDAWTVEDNEERLRVLRDAWDAYNDARKDARKVFQSAKRKAWHEYFHDREDCHGRAEDLVGSTDRPL